MSKHSKALRNHIGTISDPTVRALLGDVADCTEALERQLRIARKALMYIEEQSARPGCQTGANPWDAAMQALKAMRQARRKP